MDLRYGLLFVVLCSILLPCSAALEPHHVQISLNLSPRPTEGSTRIKDDPYEQKASLQIKISGLTEDSTKLRIEWIIFYAEVSSNGRIHRKEFGDESILTLKRGEEKHLKTRDLVLSGKVNRAGHLQGMRYEGYGIQIYEGDHLIVEDYQPSNLKSDFAHSSTRSSKLTDTLTPDSNSPSLPSGSVILFDQTFSHDEVLRILEIVNEKSESELSTEVGLSKPAVRNIANGRPFTSLRELSSVSYVKKTAFNKLKKYVQKNL
jgi:hypothetical protein